MRSRHRPSGTSGPQTANELATRDSLGSIVALDWLGIGVGEAQSGQSYEAAEFLEHLREAKCLTHTSLNKLLRQLTLSMRINLQAGTHHYETSRALRRRGISQLSSAEGPLDLAAVTARRLRETAKPVERYHNTSNAATRALGSCSSLETQPAS